MHAREQTPTVHQNGLIFKHATAWNHVHAFYVQKCGLFGVLFLSASVLHKTRDDRILITRRGTYWSAIQLQNWRLFDKTPASVHLR